MNNFFEKVYFGNTFLEWVTAFSIVLFSVTAGKILYWFSGAILKKLTKKTETKFDDIVIDQAEEPVVLALTLWGIEYGLTKLRFTEKIDSYIERGMDFMITLALAWLVIRVIDGLIQEYVVPIVEKSENNLDDAILPIVRRGFRIMVWVIAFVIGLNNAGYDVGAFLAGLGIGGLALAIAARNTVMNIIGGLTILVTQPFKITDRILVDKYDGTVLDIGLINTVIKIYVDETIASIPNKIFTDKEVVNITLARAKKAVFHITLKHGTKSEDLQLFIQKIKKMVLLSDELEDDCKLSLHEFCELGYKIEFIFYIKNQENSWDCKAKVGIKIMEIMSELNLSLGKMTTVV
jgi:MscS family membrane protein